MLFNVEFLNRASPDGCCQNDTNKQPDLSPGEKSSKLKFNNLKWPSCTQKSAIPTTLACEISSLLVITFEVHSFDRPSQCCQ